MQYLIRYRAEHYMVSPYWPTVPVVVCYYGPHIWATMVSDIWALSESEVSTQLYDAIHI